MLVKNNRNKNLLDMVEIFEENKSKYRDYNFDMVMLKLKID